MAWKFLRFFQQGKIAPGQGGSGRVDTVYFQVPGFLPCGVKYGVYLAFFLERENVKSLH